MNESAVKQSTAKNSFLKKVVIYAATLLAAVHIFFTFLWIAPNSALREIVPGELLTQYMRPMFNQSWSVFAPDPINADFHFDVRAVVATDAGEVTTEWVRATEVEQSRAMYALFPPRSSNLATGVASSLVRTWNNLNDESKAVVELNYFKGTDWQQRFNDDMSKNQSSKANTLAYVDAERVATAYATQVAKAVWGESVVRVQYRAARQNVVPFEERNNEKATRPPERPVPTGWRGLVIEEPQSTEQFAEYFCSAPVEVCGD